jgi:hypothetical protein
MLLVIRALLQIVALVIKNQSDKEQQRIGADSVIKQTLVDIAINARIAKKIDDASRDWGVNDIDQRLSKYYRDQPTED